MVDLVIKNERSMNTFLRFLILATNTLDGVRNSAQGLINRLFTDSCRARAREIKRERPNVRFPKNFEAIVPPNEKVKFRQKHKIEIYRQTYFKYKLMRIRIKIGFHAF